MCRYLAGSRCRRELPKVLYPAQSICHRRLRRRLANRNLYVFDNSTCVSRLLKYLCVGAGAVVYKYMQQLGDEEKARKALKASETW